MSDIVKVEWTANWTCPKCGEFIDNAEYDIDFSDSQADVKCKEFVDNGELRLELCGHEYKVNR